MKKKLKDFIENNKLKFTKGRRNSDLVILCGYALHLEDVNNYKEDARYYLTEALKPFVKKDWEVDQEMNRVYDFADDNGYASWWKIKANASQYII